MFAIIETGGKQILVEEGKSIFIEKIDGEKNDKVVFDKVLVLNDQIGTPYVEKATITGVVEKQGLGKKLVIWKTQPKSNWKTKQGHRQAYTRVKITDIKG